MPKSENIEHFNRVVLVVFDRLYSQFPVAVDLSVAEIAEAATPDSLPTNAAYKDLEPTFESIQFLATEGFLSYSGQFLEGTTFTTVKLTLKGLTVLGQIGSRIPWNGSRPSSRGCEAFLQAGRRKQPPRSHDNSWFRHSLWHHQRLLPQWPPSQVQAANKTMEPTR